MRIDEAIVLRSAHGLPGDVLVRAAASSPGISVELVRAGPDAETASGAEARCPVPAGGSCVVGIVVRAAEGAAGVGWARLEIAATPTAAAPTA